MYYNTEIPSLQPLTSCLDTPITTAHRHQQPYLHIYSSSPLLVRRRRSHNTTASSRLHHSQNHTHLLALAPLAIIILLLLLTTAMVGSSTSSSSSHFFGIVQKAHGASHIPFTSNREANIPPLARNTHASSHTASSSSLHSFGAVVKDASPNLAGGVGGGIDFPWYDRGDSPVASLYRPGSTAIEVDRYVRTVGWGSDASGVGMEHGSNASMVIVRSITSEVASGEHRRTRTQSTDQRQQHRSPQLGSTTTLSPHMSSSNSCGGIIASQQQCITDACRDAQFAINGGGYYGYVGACAAAAGGINTSTNVASSIGAINVTTDAESIVHLPSLVVTVSDSFGMPLQQPFPSIQPLPPTQAEYGAWSSVYATVELLPDPSWVPIGLWNTYSRLRNASAKQRLYARYLVSSRVFPVPTTGNVSSSSSSSVLDENTRIPKALHVGNYTFLFRPDDSKILVSGLQLVKPRTGTYTLKITVYNSPVGWKNSTIMTSIPGVSSSSSPQQRNTAPLVSYIKYVVYPSPRASFIKALSAPRTFNPYYPLSPQPHFILRDASGNRIDRTDVNTSLISAFVSHVRLTSGVVLQMYPVGTEKLPNGTYLKRIPQTSTTPNNYYYSAMSTTEFDSSVPSGIPPLSLSTSSTSSRRGMSSTSSTSTSSRRDQYVSLGGWHSLGMVRGVVAFDSLQVLLGPNAPSISLISSITIRLSLLNVPISSSTTTVLNNIARGDVIGLSVSVEASRFCTLPPSSAVRVHPTSLLFEQVLNRSQGGYPSTQTAATQGYTPSGLLEVKILTTASFRASYQRYVASSTRRDFINNNPPSSTSSLPTPISMCQYGFDRDQGTAFTEYPLLDNATVTALKIALNSSSGALDAMFLGEAEIVDDCLLICRFNISKWGTPVAALWQYNTPTTSTTTTPSDDGTSGDAPRRRFVGNFSRPYLRSHLQTNWQYTPSIAKTYFPPPNRIGDLPPINPYFPDVAPILLREFYHPSIIPSNPITSPPSADGSSSYPFPGVDEDATPFVGYVSQVATSPITTLDGLMESSSSTSSSTSAIVRPGTFRFLSDRGFALRTLFSDQEVTSVSLDPYGGTLVDEVSVSLITARGMPVNYQPSSSPSTTLITQQSLATSIATGAVTTVDSRSLPITRPVDASVVTTLLGAQHSAITHTNQIRVYTNDGSILLVGDMMAALDPSTGEVIFNYINIVGFPPPSNYTLLFVGLVATNPECVDWNSNMASPGCTSTTITDLTDVRVVRGTLKYKLTYGGGSVCKPPPAVIGAVGVNQAGVVDEVSVSYCKTSSTTSPLPGINYTIASSCTSTIPSVFLITGLYFEVSGARVFVGKDECYNVQHNTTNPTTALMATCPVRSGSWNVRVVTSLTMAGESIVPLVYSNPPLTITSITGCPLSALNSTESCSSTAATVITLHGTEFGMSATALTITMLQRVPTQYPPHLPLTCTSITAISNTAVKCTIPASIGIGYQFTIYNKNTKEWSNSSGIPPLPPSVNYASSIGYLCTIDHLGYFCFNRGLCDFASGLCRCDTTTGYFTGAACGECLAGYYGANCSSACPACVSGTCNDGLFGDGMCSCIVGFWGDLCDSDCPGGADAPCRDHGICNPRNGTCACYGDATNGYWADATCSTCNPFYSGLDCTLPCPVYNGAPCSGHGTCLDGQCACNANYCDTTCNISFAGCEGCPAGLWGSACNNTCPGGNGTTACSGNGVCSDGPFGSGLCSCNTGYGGTSCNITCPPNATNPCSGHGLCSQQVGTCTCNFGYALKDCSQECPGGFNSPCSGRGRCDIDTGKCVCRTGYSGPACSVDCPGGTVRPCNLHGDCIQASSSCSCYQNTTAGFWTGTACSSCSTDWWGANCREQCNFINGSQCAGHGKCTMSVTCSCFRSSQIGFWAGVNCTECLDGYFGPTCTSECPGTACNSCSMHGTCLQGIAGNGTCICFRSTTNGYWDNNFCSDCLDGYYGDSCKSKCPIGVGGATCSGRGTCDSGVFGTGVCTCSGTWGGLACEGCSTGFWGTNCANKCPGPLGQPCLLRGFCNNSIYASGTCKCDYGYGGSDCGLECPRGPYGICNSKGTCILSGSAMACINCLAGSDTGYWMGYACDECVGGYYGPQCSSECPGGASTPCNLAGRCSDGYSGTGGCKCLYGYSGLSCTRECVGGALSPCSGHGTCDTTTGTCACYSDSVKGFWIGANCSQCNVSYGGYTCVQPCPIINGESCNGHGTCFEGTCLSCYGGYCGSTCTQTSGCIYCPTNTWGSSCTDCPGGTVTPCNGHGLCLSGAYNTGKCICTPTYRGADCSLRCPGPENIACFGRGICASDATCSCSSGYAGLDCNTTCRGYSPLTGNPSCNARGVCDVSDGTCTCTYGFGGLACGIPCPATSSSYPPCDGHGICTTDGNCTCNATDSTGHWGGASCSRCAEGYFGSACKRKCINGVSNADFTGCTCFEYWSGDACDIPCPGLLEGSVCYGHGNCSWGQLFASTCTCFDTWYNTTCQKYCTTALCDAALTNGQCNINTGFCECQFDSSGHWVTSTPGGQCDICDPNYYGENCESECKCNGNGLCDRRTGLCVCFASPINGFWGNKFCDACLDGYVGVQCKGLNVKISPLGTYGASVAVPSLDYLRGLMCYDEEYGWSIYGTDPIVVAHSDTGITANVITTSGYALECAFKNTLEVYIVVFQATRNALIVLNRQTGGLLRTEYVQRLAISTITPTSRDFQPMKSVFGSHRLSKIPGVFVTKTSPSTLLQASTDTRINASSSRKLSTQEGEDWQVDSDNSYVYTSPLDNMSITKMHEQQLIIEPLKYQHQKFLDALVQRMYLDSGSASKHPAIYNPTYADASRAFSEQAALSGQDVVDSQMLPSVQGATADLIITPYQFGTFTYLQLAAGFVSTSSVAFLGRPIHVRGISTASSSSSATSTALLITSQSSSNPAAWEIAITSSAFPDAPGKNIVTTSQFYSTFNTAIQAACLPVGTCYPVRAAANADIVVAAFLSTSSTFLVKMPIVGNASSDAFAVQIMLETAGTVTGLEFDDYSGRGYIASHTVGTPTLITKFNLASAVVSGTISLSVVGADREIAIRMTGRSKQRVLEMLVPLSNNQRIVKLAMYAVSRLDPTLADTKGGTMITLLGEGMIEGMRCDFGGRGMPSNFLNASAIQCLTPSGGTESCEGEIVEAVISSIGKSTNKNYLKRIASAVVRKVTNNITNMDVGFVNGSFLQIDGSGFTTCDTCIYNLLKCKLYSPTVVLDENGNEYTKEIIVPATFTTSGLIHCNLPPVSEPLPIPSYLEVTIDGTIYSESLVQYSILGLASRLVVVEPTTTLNVKSNETSIIPSIVVAIADSVGHPLGLFFADRNQHLVNVSIVVLNTDEKSNEEYAASSQLLEGGTQVRDVDGIANFSNTFIVHPKVGTLLVLISDMNKGWREVVSFNVVEGEPYSMYFVRSPSRQTSNTASTLAIQPVIGLLDISGNPISTLANKATKLDFINAFYKYHNLQDQITNRSVSIPISDAVFKVEGIAITGLREESYYIVFTADLPDPQLISPSISVELCQEVEYAVKQSTTCKPCPDHAQCDGSYNLIAEDGWWRADNTTLNFYSCAAPFGAGACFNDSACFPGYYGPRCSSCSEDYGRAYMKCVKCNNTWASFLIIVAIGILLLVVLSLLIVTVSLSNYDENLPVVFRNFVTHVQILSRLGDLLIPWPDVLSNLWQTFARFSTLEAVDISPLDCALHFDYYGKYSLLLLSPWALTLCCFPIVFIILVRYRRSNEYLDRAIEITAGCRYNEAIEMLKRMTSADYIESDEQKRASKAMIKKGVSGKEVSKISDGLVPYFNPDRLDPLSIDPAPNTVANQAFARTVREMDPMTGKFVIVAVVDEVPEGEGDDSGHHNHHSSRRVLASSRNPLAFSSMIGQPPQQQHFGEGENNNNSQTSGDFESIAEDGGAFPVDADGAHHSALWSPREATTAGQWDVVDGEQQSTAPVLSSEGESPQPPPTTADGDDDHENSFQYFPLSTAANDVVSPSHLHVFDQDEEEDELDLGLGEDGDQWDRSAIFNDRRGRRQLVPFDRVSHSTSTDLSLSGEDARHQSRRENMLRNLGDDGVELVKVELLRQLLDGRSNSITSPTSSREGSHSSSLPVSQASDKTRLWHVLHLTRIAHTLRIMRIRDSRYRPIGVILISAVTVFSLLYPTLVQASGQVLRCETLDLGAEGFQEVSVNQRVTLCNSDTHQFYRIIAITAIVGYGALIPAAIVMSVLLLSKLIPGGFLVARAVLNFIMTGLKSNLWFWEAVNMMRKFACMVVVVFIAQSKLQVISFMWVVAVGCLLQVNFAPYTHPAVHYLECLGQSCMVVTLNVVLLFFFLYDQDLNSDPRWIAMTTIIVTLNVIAALAYLIVMVYFLYWKLISVWRNRNDSKERESMAINSIDAIRSNVIGVDTLRQTKAELIEKVRALHLGLEKLEDEEMEQRTTMFGLMTGATTKDADDSAELDGFKFGVEADGGFGGDDEGTFGNWTFPQEGAAPAADDDENGGGALSQKMVQFNESANATTVFGEGMPVSVPLARENRRRGVDIDAALAQSQSHNGVARKTSSEDDDVGIAWDGSIWLAPDLSATHHSQHRRGTTSVGGVEGSPSNNGKGYGHDGPSAFGWVEGGGGDSIPFGADDDVDGLENIRRQTREALRIQFGAEDSSDSSNAAALSDNNTIPPTTTQQVSTTNPDPTTKHNNKAPLHPRALTENALRRHLRAAAANASLSHHPLGGGDRQSSAAHSQRMEDGDAPQDEPFIVAFEPDDDDDDNNDMGGIAARRGQFLYNLTDLADGDSGPNTQSKQEAIRDWVSQRDVTDTAPRDDPTATTHLNLADSGIFDPSYMPEDNNNENSTRKGGGLRHPSLAHLDEDDDVFGLTHPLEASPHNNNSHSSPATLDIFNPTAASTLPPLLATMRRGKDTLGTKDESPPRTPTTTGGELKKKKKKKTTKKTSSVVPTTTATAPDGEDVGTDALFGGPLDFDVQPTVTRTASTHPPLFVEITSQPQASNPWATGRSISSPHFPRGGAGIHNAGRVDIINSPYGSSTGGGGPPRISSRMFQDEPDSDSTATTTNHNNNVGEQQGQAAEETAALCDMAFGNTSDLFGVESNNDDVDVGETHHRRHHERDQHIDGDGGFQLVLQPEDDDDNDNITTTTKGHQHQPLPDATDDFNDMWAGLNLNLGVAGDDNEDPRRQASDAPPSTAGGGDDASSAQMPHRPRSEHNIPITLKSDEGTDVDSNKIKKKKKKSKMMKRKIIKRKLDHSDNDDSPDMVDPTAATVGIPRTNQHKAPTAKPSTLQNRRQSSSVFESSVVARGGGNPLVVPMSLAGRPNPFLMDEQPSQSPSSSDSYF